MRDRQFHLGWFLQGSSIQSWGEPWTGNIGDEWMEPELFMDLARSIERACFDYMLLEDTSYVGEAYQNSRDIYLRYGMSVPRQDPSVIASMMLQITRRLGVIATFATFAYPPYLVARLVGTLDQVSGGRAGWNMVTGSSDFAAMNFGQDRLPEHDLRYDMADEYIDVVRRLWESWESAAIVADRQSGIIIDPAKVRQIDFVGQYYRCRGPLNSGPAPQGHPVIAQAGGSSKGRSFAARHADTIVAQVMGVDAMKEYRRDVRARLAANGRDPDSCKVLFLVAPVLADTAGEARQRAAERALQAARRIDVRLAGFAKITNIDFSTFDLDAPVGELTTNGHQQLLAEFLVKAGKRTLREAITEYASSSGSVDLIGTVDQVADRMGEVMQEVGGDGFLFSLPNTNRRSIAEVTDGLVPALQQRGLARREYRFKHLRDMLLEF